MLLIPIIIEFTQFLTSLPCVNVHAARLNEATRTTSPVLDRCILMRRRVDPVFSRMRSKGSRFTLVVWGLRVCSLDVAFASATVRNRSRLSATVRDCPQPFAWGPYGRAYSEFCKSGRFWTCPRSCSLVSRGRRDTLWHSNMFHNVSEVVVCVCLCAWNIWRDVKLLPWLTELLFLIRFFPITMNQFWVFYQAFIQSPFQLQGAWRLIS